MHASHRRDAVWATLPLVVSILVILFLWVFTIPASIKSWVSAPLLHMALGTVATLFASMIFAITWHTPQVQNNLRSIMTGCIFAGVAVLDFSHMLSYAGASSFVTHSGTDNAIDFWLAARAFACVGLLILVVMPYGRSSTTRQAWLTLSTVLLLVFAIHAQILFNAEFLTQVFIEGHSLTSWKTRTGYGLFFTYLLAAALLARKLTAPRASNISGLIAVAILMALSEFTLTYNADATDFYSLAGNILKVTAYFYLYQLLFVESLQTRQSMHKHQTDIVTHLFSQATAQNPNPVIITDLRPRIEYVNEAFTRVSGYSASEVIGRNPRLLQSGKTSQDVYVDMWSKLSCGQSWEGELINRRKNGQEYTEEALIYPIRNEAGTVTLYLAYKQDVGDKKTASERIQYLSEFDQLTGLPNRTLLLEQLQFAVSQARREVKPLAVLWLNLDLFRDINNTFGHASGDSVLREAAHRMREITQEGDIIARYSGDNFVFARANTDQYGAIQMVNQLLNVLSRPIVLQDEELILTASMGLALYPNDGVSVTDLMRCAETAMYRVKHESRNSYSFYSPDMQERTARALQLTNALKLAFTRQELHLVYQPQVSLQDGHVTGAEALLRWHHPQLGDISPAEFIPLAENAGLGSQVGEWVLQNVLKDLHEWESQGVPLVKVAVNLSAVQFAEHDLADKVKFQLEQSKVAPQWLEFELTEIAAMKNPEQAAQSMLDLATLGLKLSIDDFGTGYSSLSHLKRFKVYKLKIDQSFVRNIVDDPEDKAIVDAIISMAHSLGMITIAEGVETSAQLAFLKAHHCDEIQGYLYSRPLRKLDFEQLLRSPPAIELPA